MVEPARADPRRVDVEWARAQYGHRQFGVEAPSN